ncbi:MAG TPA: hypothetical protein PK781_04385 [Terrimesophilobacter sp.]|nr:hypothetical protein [Terrimesophilobacter sp.]
MAFKLEFCREIETVTTNWNRLDSSADYLANFDLFVKGIAVGYLPL